MNQQAPAPQVPQPPPAPEFPFDIPSVAQKNPGLPGPVLGLLDLNRSIRTGQPLDYAQVKNARASAEALKGIHAAGKLPQLTERMVISAHARAVALDSTYATVEYTPHDIAQTLKQINNRLEEINGLVQDIDQRTEGMDGHITTINDTLRIGHAHTANLRIVNRNARLQAPNVLEPLQKTVLGSGRGLVTPLLAVLDQVNRRAFLNGAANANVDAAEIGTQPPDFDPYVESYSDCNVLEMIVFYNETFGIVPTDISKVWASKFRRFLAEF